MTSSKKLFSVRKPDIGFIPTPPVMVEAMVQLAEVSADDVVYDLGCGDGRVLIVAAQQFGCRGVGIDIDPVLVKAAQEKAVAAGVGDRLTFYLGDLYEADVRSATVVMLYLLPHLNLKLLPRLRQQLQPGARIVSRDFDMGDWQPERSLAIVVDDEAATLYRWTMPPGALSIIK
jgi:SAM-dependent methyltransferase